MTTVSSATTQPQQTLRVSFVDQHQTTSKKAGAFFIKMASHLTWHICWCSSAVHRFKSPMIPGKYDFSPTESEEKTTRLAYKAGLVLMAPIGVIGGALGNSLSFYRKPVAGGRIWLSGRSCNRKTFPECTFFCNDLEPMRHWRGNEPFPWRGCRMGKKSRQDR